MSYPEKDSLPQGAITHLTKMLSQHLLNWHDDLDDVNTIAKGLECENDSIQLYNDVNFTQYSKNTGRVTKDNLTGECDIIDHENRLIIDIKTAWNKKTFPLLLNVEDKKDYFWQLVAYMYLYDCEYAELAYCLVSTPSHLIPRNEFDSWHEVDDVPQALRVTTARIQRTEKAEKQLLDRIKLGQAWLNEQLEKRGLK